MCHTGVMTHPDTNKFYDNIIGFSDFSDVNNRKHYTPAPDDWYIVVADVEGSTKAIENGRYKDVNLVGASCIVAGVNACTGIPIPYVFGGDGATFLVPETHLDAIKTELLAVQHFAREYYDLSLRLGAVPMHEIKTAGNQCLVAKYKTDTGCALAMFDGGGISLADDIVKSGRYNFVNSDSSAVMSPNLDGLTCRWKPVKNQSGSILSIMIKATKNDEDNNDVYKEISSQIQSVLKGPAHPISIKNMKYKWPGFETFRQAQILWRGPNQLINMLSDMFWIMAFRTMNCLNLTIKGVALPHYRETMVSNSDYQKFDDVLRMVVDCTPRQGQMIGKILEKFHADDRLVYGMHYSDDALVTCFVRTFDDDGHIHFIDGGNGGYALAAKQMKSQIKNIMAI
jgi:hypothetical protein